MKRLDFPAASDELDLYNLAYIALNHPEARLSPPELRTHAKILDKFEAIALKQTDGTGYKLPKGKDASLVLEDAEFALAKRLAESFPWNTANSRKAVRLFDLLDGAPDYLVSVPDPAQG